MGIGAPTARTIAPPLGAALLLLVISVLRFVFPDAQGVMLYAVIPIALLGIMLGIRAGLLAATVASIVSLIWAGTNGEHPVAEYFDEPITFFILGGLSGFFAHGALGSYDLRAAARCTAIRRALREGEIVLYYQPISSTGDGLLGVEALARWEDPRRGTVPPIDFIPFAESDERTIWDLTLKTLELAVGEGGVADNDSLGMVAVNLSPVVLGRSDLLDAVGGVLQKSALPARRLALEVTESAFTDGDDAAISTLAEIKGLGIGMVALDDFGIGQSSLARLARLPVDAVKIDRSLISPAPPLGRRQRSRDMVKAIVELGHAIDLTVIAEGVEDESTLDWLTELGCDAWQGFHLSRAVPLDQLQTSLGARQTGSVGV